jgi:predicted PurR-regulated permease PerM
VAFKLFGLENAGSLGVVAGLLELLPVIGPLTVALMAAGQAESQALAIVAFLVALRGVQDYIVYPRLVRRSMPLSSITVIVTVWLGAVLNGAAGVLFAIPFAGFLSVSARHWREYRAVEGLVRNSAQAERSPL